METSRATKPVCQAYLTSSGASYRRKAGRVLCGKPATHMALVWVDEGDTGWTFTAMCKKHLTVLKKRRQHQAIVVPFDGAWWLINGEEVDYT